MRLWCWLRLVRSEISAWKKKSRDAKMESLLFTWTSVHTSKRKCLKRSSPPPLQGLLPTTLFLPCPCLHCPPGQESIRPKRLPLGRLLMLPSPPLWLHILCAPLLPICYAQAVRIFFLKPGSDQATPSSPIRNLPVPNLTPFLSPPLHTHVVPVIASLGPKNSP